MNSDPGTEAMQFDNQHFKILKDISAFSGIKRYRGMLPAKLAVFHHANKVEELVEEECVERIVFSLACGSERVMLKLTERGHELLEELLPMYEEVAEKAEAACKDEEAEPEPTPEVSKAQCILLSDVYHYSKIHIFGGLMPNDILETYESKDVSSLSGNGYLIHVKAEVGKGKKRKGVILSDKALRLLQRFNLVPANALAPPWKNLCG
jgi:molybdenum-dependent DNA-binding transcriptional regulator ModE